MKNFINLQYIFSYLGLIPYILIVIDKFFIFFISKEIMLSFNIYYTLLIIVFVGAINWNLQENISSNIIIYGFLPSLFSVIIISLHLYLFNSFYLLLMIMLALLMQLIFDYIFIYRDALNKKVFYFVRLPLTFLIVLNLIFIKFQL
tara:strand:- start:227 stop:664 length:438 start_codon:yes stop_codon:yes gene_type:complete